MKDNKPETIRLTRREAIKLGVGTLLGTAVAVRTGGGGQHTCG